MRNKKEVVEGTRNILKEFERVSSQKVNLSKSIAYFSPNTLSDQMTSFNGMLEMRVLETMDNYLGLPLIIMKKKTRAFQHILDRFTNRINSWSKRLLSYGGKDIFIKAILQSLSFYAFSCFLMPRGLIEEMVSRIQGYWWASKHKGRGCAIMAWDTVCTSKGMGFCDLNLFNIVMLYRKLWHLINYKDTISFKVLSAKYFSKGNVLH